MFYENQSKQEKAKYTLLLKIIGSLSKLASDNFKEPYLHYRIAENIFCRAFSAKNLSRSDISIDASKNSFGIGLKTFIHRNGNILEKIAEFNKERNLYTNYEKQPSELIKNISEYRNNRIEATCRICDLNPKNLIYHCISRAFSKFYISEIPLNLITIEKISNIKQKENVINFQDNLSEYCFNLSKSTLYKRFNVIPLTEIPIKILDDPFDLLERHFTYEFKEPTLNNPITATICLPLYSVRDEKHVPKKSGLNHWNAGGRIRHSNEVYIPIPKIIHKLIPDFFPSREESFTLHLPNGKSLRTKVCQDNNKALMT